MTFANIKTQAAVIRVEVEFDHDEVTAWCPVTRGIVELVITDDIAEGLEGILEDLVVEATKQKDWYRWDAEGGFCNIWNYEIVSGYIGENSETVVFSFDDLFDESKVYHALDMLYNSDPDSATYDVVVQYIKNYCNSDIERFDAGIFIDEYIGEFNDERQFIEWDSRGRVSAEGIAFTDYGRTHFSMALEDGGIAMFRYEI